MAKTAFITGASSGIGRALALELAGRGWDLGLAARRVPALEELKAEILARTGGSDRRVETRSLDVTDTGAVRVVMQDLDGALGGLDMVVANAGIALNHKIGSPGFERDEQTIHTNLLGAMATVDAAAEIFNKTGGGHIVALSSVAAYRGMPGLGAYSASKAALLKYCEAARVELRGRGTRVTTLLPGYIDTPLNQDVKSRPFLVTAEVGARRIADLIERGVSTSTVPVMPWSVFGLLMRAVPNFLWDRMLGGPMVGVETADGDNEDA
ncbi:MAG TPA: SDR family NAD(P)-dependent oxidoreductase [Deltaproteobacteria bacterium]|nr:SDR family NAD(P)-dependent oxidoreductase [Candidatus Binatota bacterium]HIL12481.1 SDR family NAD(P)-dependent oxidoreductase [Deltaproteobacteria bacterium]